MLACVESEALFRTYGFTFDRVVKANSADMALAVGPLVKLRDGTLVNDSGNYYFISDGRKLMFSSGAYLAARGDNPSSAIIANLSAYDSGGMLQ